MFPQHKTLKFQCIKNLRSLSDQIKSEEILKLKMNEIISKYLFLPFVYQV